LSGKFFKRAILLSPIRITFWFSGGSDQWVVEFLILLRIVVLDDFIGIERSVAEVDGRQAEEVRVLLQTFLGVWSSGEVLGGRFELRWVKLSEVELPTSLDEDDGVYSVRGTLTVAEKQSVCINGLTDWIRPSDNEVKGVEVEETTLEGTKEMGLATVRPDSDKEFELESEKIGGRTAVEQVDCTLSERPDSDKEYGLESEKIGARMEVELVGFEKGIVEEVSIVEMLVVLVVNKDEFEVVWRIIEILLKIGLTGFMEAV